MICVLKVSSSTFLMSHPGSVRPIPPPLHLSLLKSATPSACIWTTSCVLTECETPTLWRTHTSWVRQCATTEDSSTCRKTLIELSLKHRQGRKSQTWLSSCSPSPTRASSEMSEYHDINVNVNIYMCVYSFNQWMKACIGTERICTVSAGKSSLMWNNVWSLIIY